MSLSVIIPNFNGAQFIDTLCEALDNQTLRTDKYEIIVVDNGSTDDSVVRFKHWGRHHENFKLFSYTDKQSSYAARNHGVGQSKGDVLMFTDIDCVPETDWLELFHEKSKNMEGVYLIVGDIVLFPSGKDFNYYEWYDKCAFLNQKAYARHKTGATANLAVSRLGYEQVGGFLEVYSGGDRMFSRQVMSLKGARFIYMKNAIVRHPARSDFNAVLKKSRRVARGIAELNHTPRQWGNNSRYLLKNILGFIFVPHQLRLAKATFSECGYFNLFSWKFLFLACYLGWVIRANLIFRFMHLLVGKKEVAGK